MGSLTPADVKRWDLSAIRAVFQTASGRVATLQRLGDNLQQAHDVLAEWQGEAGDAFRADVGKVRRDIEADGAEAKQVAAAVERAEADVSACKSELDGIERAAQANGWSITSDWRIDPGPKGIPANRIDLAHQLEILQSELNACKVHAHTADHELAAAIAAAVGAAPLNAGGSAPGGAPTAQGATNRAPGGKPKTWQDLVMPPGAADATPAGAGPGDPAASRGTTKTWQDLVMPPTAAGTPPGHAPSDAPPKAPPAAAVAPGGVPPKGAPIAAGAVGKPKTWQDMLLPAGRLPPQPLNPADVETAKGLLRNVMLGDGVPPDQVEARLNEVVAAAQRYVDNGMPNYIPPEPKAPPPPGFGEGFGDRWRATEQGIHNLLGVGGPGAPGVLESWTQMVKGTLETVQNPVGAAVEEVRGALDSPSPAYYLGGKGADAAFAVPGMIFGPEGLGVGKLADFDAAAAIDYGPTHLPHTPVGFDNPIRLHSFADQAGQDLYAAFVHGEPTTTLTRQLAEMSTHYVGDAPDRVVLGKYGGLEGGYIGEARGQGGIYFDTGNPVWDAMTYGLGKADEQRLVWPVNEQFLRGQMESGVPRIEYHLPRQFGSVEELMMLDPESYSGKEIAFLKRNAEVYGYRQVGNVWVHVTGER
ncbi:WXG100 family type VII secretion target [Mycobacterium simiae]|uniref:WXG100 family type VII secretion target n=1 Tax=Mycobacterium simiae TaxID=1784 RepID=UPI0004196805|nr:endonuclease [Mycobacterium tuberculosis variant microti OV254]BBX39565.1 hypothetical protein MSIM_10160 [Mycobacterium simiae]